MRATKIRSLLFAAGMGLAAVFIMVGFLGSSSQALAQGSERELSKMVSQDPVGPILAVVVFTDPATVAITDILGNVVGGTHVGEVRCNSNSCNHKTLLQITDETDPRYQVVYEYKFTSLVAFDLEAERVVVAGTGTIISSGKKARFFFTATFENNGDGTVSATYVASRPDASFMVPESPGTLTIFSR